MSRSEDQAPQQIVLQSTKSYLRIDQDQIKEQDEVNEEDHTTFEREVSRFHSKRRPDVIIEGCESNLTDGTLVLSQDP